MKVNRLFAILLSILIAVILIGCNSESSGSDSDLIKIGITGPLTGPSANSGVALEQGMKMAVDEWNEKGGIEVDGETKKIEMIYEDNQAQPAEAVSTVEKLINQDNVHFLIADAFGSSQTMAVMDLSTQYEIPMMSGEPVSSAISERIEENPDQYKYFWKGNFSSESYGEGAYYTIQSLIDSGQFTPENKTVAFIVEDTDYGRSNVAEAQKLFENDGWEQVAFETVDLDYTDFYPQLTKIKSLNVDVLITCFTSVSSGVALVKQFNETEVNALHMAIYYPIRPEFYEQAGEDANGLIWEPLSYDKELVDKHREFEEKFQDIYGIEGSADAAQGYDYMNNALTAIANAKSLDPDKIVEQLSQLSIEGVAGYYEFDLTNQTIKAGPDYVPVPAAQVQDGVNQIIWPENMATTEYEIQPWLK